MTVADLIGQIESTDIVVATRFHNVLLALMRQKPVISISYNRKNDSLMAEVGLGDYCLHVRDFDVRELIAKFAGIVMKADEVKPRLGDRTKSFRMALEEQYRLILGLPRSG